MGKPNKPVPVPPKDNKVSREARVTLAPTSPHIVLEPPLQPQDEFELQKSSPGSAAAKPGKKGERVSVGSGGLNVVQFDLIHEGSTYELIQSRGAGGRPAREPVEGHMPASFLTGQPWGTLAPPPTSRRKDDPNFDPSKLQKAREDAPALRESDQDLLTEKVTHFYDIPAEEPKGSY